jgi:hypothetical protein
MEFMLQFDAKIIYIKGDNNLVAKALSCYPMSHSAEEAKQTTQHPYSFCADDDTDNFISSIWPTAMHGPWESVKSLAGCASHLSSVNATMSITADRKFLEAVKDGYAKDVWCQMLPSTALSLPNLTIRDGLWYIGNWLIIPRLNNLCEMLFSLAHNVLSHLALTKPMGLYAMHITGRI